MKNLKSFWTTKIPLLFAPVALSAAIGAGSAAGSELADVAASSDQALGNHRGGGYLDGNGRAGGGASRNDNTCATTQSVFLQSLSVPFMANPKVYFIFWGSYWNSGTGLNEYNTDTSQWSSLVRLDGFWKQLAEYGISDGQYLGASVQIPSFNTSSPIPENGARGTQTVTGQLLAEIGQNGVPASDSNTLYVLMMPNGVVGAYDQSGPFNGHHQSTTLSGQQGSVNTTNVYYAVMEYNASSSTVNQVISHEIYEATTDPVVGTAWCDNSKNDCGQNEIGDCCNSQPQTLAGYTVQQVWSQNALQCIGSPTQVLEAIAVGADAEPWFTVRLPNRYWDSFGTLFPLGGSAQLAEMTSVAPANVQAIIFDGSTMWHSVRSQNGQWTTFGNASAAMSTTQAIASLGMADVVNDTNGQDEMQLCAVGTNGVLYHAVRHADGSWTTLNDTRSVLGNPEGFSAVDCAGFGDTLQIVAIGHSGAAYHGIRNANGTWIGLNLLSSNVGGEPGVAVSVANVSNELHVAAISYNVQSSTSNLLHQIRHADGSWTGWATPPTWSGGATAVTAAQVNNQLNLIVTSNGAPLHAIRSSDGNWTPFGNITTQTGNPDNTTFGSVTATGANQTY